MRKCILVIMGLLVTFVSGAALVVWYGFYNISAVQPHLPLTYWFLATARDQSIARHSKWIESPPLTHPQLSQFNFCSFHCLCAVCHGVPGQDLPLLGEGMNPPPPKLESQQVQRRLDAELYWIIKNGIKMTGMPAFGPGHTDEELWAMVAFVRRLPDLKPQDMMMGCMSMMKDCMAMMPGMPGRIGPGMSGMMKRQPGPLQQGDGSRALREMTMQCQAIGDAIDHIEKLIVAAQRTKDNNEALASLGKAKVSAKEMKVYTSACAGMITALQEGRTDSDLPGTTQKKAEQ